MTERKSTESSASWLQTGPSWGSFLLSIGVLAVSGIVVNQVGMQELRDKNLALQADVARHESMIVSMNKDIHTTSDQQINLNGKFDTIVLLLRDDVKAKR